MPRDVTATSVCPSLNRSYPPSSGETACTTQAGHSDGRPTVANTGIASSMQADKQECTAEIGSLPLADAHLPANAASATALGSLPTSAETSAAHQAGLDRSLREAALEGLPERVVTLIAAGASLNATNKNGATALMIAAQRGHLEVVKALRAAGAKADAANKSGETALTLAAQQGHVKVVNELRACGAWLSDVQISRNLPVLKRAIEARNWSVSVALIAAGLHLFMVYGQSSVSGLLAKSASGAAGATEVMLKALALGAASQRLQQVELDCALACAAALEKNGLTRALYLAGARLPDSCLPGAERGLRDMVRASNMAGTRAWLEAGVNVNAANQDNVTALMYAAHFNFSPLIQLLIKAGADLNLFDKDGETALVHAAKCGMFGAADILLFHGAGVESHGPGSSSALKWAVELNHLNIANVLVQYGAPCIGQDLLTAVIRLNSGVDVEDIGAAQFLLMASQRARNWGLVYLAALIPLEVPQKYDRWMN